MKRTRTYTPKIMSTIILFLLFAISLAYLLYSWKQYGGIFYLLISIVALIGVIAFGRPLIFFSYVTIDNGKRITIRYWSAKGYSEDIYKALYEIVVKNDGIKSFRFNIQNKYFQISPATYHHGDELADILKSSIEKGKLILSIVD